MVYLEKMTEEDYKDYIKGAINEYADAHVKAGTWSKEESIELSKQSFEKLLPERENTKQHYLFSIMDNEKKVGYIWFHKFSMLSGNQAFIYDFKVFDAYQGKGYGKSAMKGIEEKAKKHDINKISLHVFAYNEGAIGLYKKMGYEVTDLHMAKYI